MLKDLLQTVSTTRFERCGLMNITSADWTENDLAIKLTIQYDDGRGDAQELWEVSCISVFEYLLSRAQRCGLQYWTEDHPALSQYTEPFESLFFGAKATIPTRSWDDCGQFTARLPTTGSSSIGTSMARCLLRTS